MTLLGISLSASAWLAPITAVAAMASAAAVILLRDHLRLERHAMALEAQLEAHAARLEDERQRQHQPLEPSAIAPGFATANTEPSIESSAGTVPAAEPTLARRLRAPLGGIAGLATLLLDTDLDGEQAIHVRRIKALAEQLAGLVEPRPPAAANVPARTERRDGTLRVLLAEDNEINGFFAVQSLEMAGAVVHWTRDGDEALAAIEASFAGDAPAYDVILMDIRMPRVGGIEATRSIRALEARLGRTDPLRIVAVTANTMPQDRIAAMAAGMNDFLAKPYRADALVGILTPRTEPLARAS